MSFKQTIFITGASGYIGSVVTQFAITAGYAVHALSRSETSDSKLVALGATPIRGDLGTLDILTRAAFEADIVINLADAFAGNFTTMTVTEREQINNTAVDALIKGLKGSGKPLVVTSGSANTAPHPQGEETDESSPELVDELFGSRMEAHALSAKDAGVRVMAVRLAPYVYGRGGSGVALFMGMFKQGGAAFWIDVGKEVRTTTVHVDDAARLYLMVAEKGRAGECYNATYETDVTQRQLAEAMGKALGLEVQKRSLEETKAKMGAFLAKFLIFENRATNMKARVEFGWEIRAEKGILEEIATGSYVQVAENMRK